MHTVTVRDHMMVAHSLPRACFGPAQRVHGATFVVDAAFTARELSPDGVVVDMGAASTLLRQVLATLDYQNLDELPELAGVLTTTEKLAEVVGDLLAAGLREGALGAAGHAVTTLVVTLRESPVAWASHERAL